MSNRAQLIVLSEERFDAWCKYHNIKLQQYQRKLALDIFKLNSLNIEIPDDLRQILPKESINTFAKNFSAMGSGLTFTFQVAEKFIKAQGKIPFELVKK